MQTLRRCTIFWLSLIMLCTPSTTAADTPAARITETSGAVTVVREDETRINAATGLGLYPGDTIETGPDGSAAFTFDRGDIFRLDEDSQLAIDELAQADEAAQPILRINLGLLWSRIKEKLSSPFSPTLHTPTAVIGIRGTEFETVVSMDAASAVAVDEGVVEVEAETQTVRITKGMVAEVDMDEKIARPYQAPPRDKRMWKNWRKKKREKLVKNLPGKMPHMRKRFEKAADRYLKNAERITQAADRMDAQIEAVRQAAATGKRGRVRAGLQKIRAMENRFRQNMPKFRKGLNRLKVVGKHSIRLEKFVNLNLNRFPPDRLTAIQADLTAIRIKREELKSAVRQTIAKVRRAHQNLRSLKKQLKERDSKTPKRGQKWK